LDNSQNGHRRHLHVLIRDDACPQLFSGMESVAVGDENAFVRAVLSQWFASHASESDIAYVVRTLVEQQRLNESMSRSGGAIGMGGPLNFSKVACVSPTDAGLACGTES
jgi:hypothetical protein